MLKTFILILTVGFANIASAQLESKILKINDSKNYYFEQVYEVNEKPKDEIFARLKAFVIRNSKGQEISNFFDDEKKNTISTNPNFVIKSVYGVIDFKLNIDIKDNKYRL